MSPRVFLGLLALSVAAACSSEGGPAGPDASRLPTDAGTEAGGASGAAGAPSDASADGASAAGGAQHDAGGGRDAGSAGAAGLGVDAGDVSVTFAPTQEDFPNPERGWFVWASDDFGASLDVGAVDAAWRQGVRLAYAMVDLGRFREGAIDASFLAALSDRLEALRGRGMKAILRFVYDYTAAGNDAPATRIVSHLEQLAPLLSEQQSAIAVVQAGFIGAWGEWHSSKHSNSYGYQTNPGVTQQQADANRRLVRDALLQAVPPTLPLAFRYPGDLIKWYPSPTTQPRVGLHNDCWLAGPDDTGTYESEAERTYVRARSASSSFGGETCDASAELRTSCSSVLTEGAQYHLGYLNREYFTGFMDAWRREGCIEEVSRSMGYRLQLEQARHATQATRGGTLRVEVTLRNVGWARLLGPRPLVVRLVDGATRATGASDVSLSSLPAQATTASVITVELRAPGAPGVYALELAAPDPHPTARDDARFAVRFANASQGAQRWDAARAAFITGTTVTVE